MGEVWQRLVQVIAEPAGAFRALCERPLVVWAFVVVAVSALAVGLQPMEIDFEDMLGFQLEQPEIEPGAARLAREVLYAVVLFWLGSLVFHYLGRAFGGKGSYRQVVSCLGFSELPGVLQAPTVLAARLFDAETIAWIGIVVLGVWTLVLNVIALREAHRFTTARAVALFIGGAIVLGIVATLIMAPFVIALG